MSACYDLAVIGTGTAATVAASRVGAAGWRVAMIDFRPFGGTCPLRGCDPKKMLVSVAGAIDQARRMQDKGVRGDVRINWPELIAFKHSFTDPIPEKREQQYVEKGFDSCRGTARFVGPTSLEVNGERLNARHVLIAAGAEPIRLGIPGEEHLITNEGFLEMDALPRRIALVGGGYIAAEFSNIAAAAGADAIVLQRDERMLTHFDPDLVSWLMDAFEAYGIDVRTRTNVEAVEKTADGYNLTVSTDGGSETVVADLVIHAAGRMPALEELDLDAAGIETEDGRLKLNSFLQSTSNPAVYAAGDAAHAGPPLTPVASHDATVVADNLLNGNQREPDYRGVPSVAFTLPPIAAVGLTEKQATERKLKYRTNCKRASDWFNARQAAQPVHGFKVLVDESTNTILGAHLVGPHADEVINLFALAIRNRLTATDLRKTMFAYPTGASDLGSMLQPTS